MTQPERPEPARSVDAVVEIGASVETVWKALTTPEGLRNFYCDWAEVTPGVGGTFQIGWHAGGLPPADIDVWDPPGRLRLTHPAPPGAPGVTTAEEWTLRREGDHTMVRLVYAGFGESTDWDAFYDRFDATARLVVDLLATWLDRHGGAPLTKLVADAPIPGDETSAWRYLGPDLHDADGRPTPVAPGSHVTVPLPGGTPLTGTARHVAPGNEASVELDDPALDAARLVAVVRPGPAPGTARLLVEIYTYGLAPEVTSAFQDRLDRAVHALTNDPLSSTASERAPRLWAGGTEDAGRCRPDGPATVGRNRR